MDYTQYLTLSLRYKNPLYQNITIVDYLPDVFLDESIWIMLPSLLAVVNLMVLQGKLLAQITLPNIRNSGEYHKILEKILNGYLPSRKDIPMILNASEKEVSLLLFVAGQLRDQGKGRTVTYSKKVFIPLTNMCRDRCGYCTFVKSPKEKESHYLTPDQVLAIAMAGREKGCKEVLFSLGDHPEWKHREAKEWLEYLGYSSTPEYVMAMSAMVLDETGLLPHTNAGILSRDELLGLRKTNVSMGIMLENISIRLLGRGGPHFGCDSKEPSLRLNVLREAGKLGIAMTTGILIGIGETSEERLESLLAIREIHEEYGNIQEVIIQNFRAKTKTRMHAKEEPSTVDMLRTLAIARLVLGGSMNIQAPPNLNSDACQTYILAGINDWGGVSPITKDHINPEAPWPVIEHLRDLTGECGYQLEERLAIYPEFLCDDLSDFSPPLRNALAVKIAEVGYNVRTGEVCRGQS